MKRIVIVDVDARQVPVGSRMRAIEIILLCIAAAVVYGIVHDQVTARVCVEYFTIGHYPLFDTTNPTLLGFGWGIVATWWVGLILGIVLAVVSRAGSRPKRSAGSLLRPVTLLLCWMALLSAAAGRGRWPRPCHRTSMCPSSRTCGRT
jgi:hypothetical protein